MSNILTQQSGLYTDQGMLYPGRRAVNRTKVDLLHPFGKGMFQCYDFVDGNMRDLINGRGESSGRGMTIEGDHLYIAPFVIPYNSYVVEGAYSPQETQHLKEFTIMVEVEFPTSFLSASWGLMQLVGGTGVSARNYLNIEGYSNNYVTLSLQEDYTSGALIQQTVTDTWSVKKRYRVVIGVKSGAQYFMRNGVVDATDTDTYSLLFDKFRSVSFGTIYTSDYSTGANALRNNNPMNVYWCKVWNRYIPPDEMASLSRDPHQMMVPSYNPSLYMPDEGATLVVADTAQSQAVENIDLTQASVLTVQETESGQTVDNITLSAGLTLSINDALHSQAAENIDLLQAGVLSIDDALQSTAVDNIDLGTGLTLTVAGSVLSQAVANIDLVQAHVLSLQEALQSSGVENIDLTLPVTLVVSDALHSALVDNITLSIPGVTGTTPDFRTFVIQSDDRLFMIDSQDRVFKVLH